MYEFKVRRCARGRSHDWTECPYAYPGEKAQRRDLRNFITLELLAPTFAKETVKEAIPVSSLTAFSSVGSTLLVILLVLPQQNPIGNGSGLGDLDHVWFSHAPPSEFGSSPTSILDSPPLSPSSESPATYPGLQMGSGSGFGSPRNLGKYDFRECNAFEEEPAMKRVESGRDLRARMDCKWDRDSVLLVVPPSTRLLQLSFNCNPGTCDEESGVWERLRARMYAKLSKENSLGRLQPTVPDIGWVSELVN
ncbi:hypothetical protein F3Y22_tig00117001pilonHSYRG00021 [Hibiscus syriacus]|uniref:AtC3H23-like CCCH zinc finger domain-containing protein n=1 Tax=Hibiscus syriacus TaxID=106335 RepID=A0A6A2WDH4_HIBSY|nr:hypothetical protein F3Y22_tig00117001pilonHSYRG00021 [Hibiscus syriacus]